MMYRVELSFKAPVHIGYMDTVYEVSDTLVHSDTIFNALICSHALLYGPNETEKLLQALLKGESKLKLSSAFYRIKNVHFLPRPKGESFGLEKSQELALKKIKKIKFVDEEIIFKKAEVSLENVRGQFLAKDPNALDGQDPFLIIERPRVSVNRYDSGSNLFYFAEVHFAPETGLWFYLSVSEDIEKNILASLKLLSEEGLGGDRTYGFGIFDYELKPVQLPSQGDRYLLISICTPSAQELSTISSKVLSYELIHRTGYVYLTDKRSKKVLAFVEGSVFKEPIEGAILDVTPEGFKEEYGYRVFRYAKAFFVPFEGGDRR